MKKKLESGNTIEFRKGKIEDQKGHAIINWTNLDLNRGPETYYRIHRKAGAQLRSSTFPFQQYIRTGDVFSTIAGLLDYYIVLHCVLPLPEEKHMYSMMIFNAVNTLEEYKRSNLCKNVYLTFPDLNQQLLMDGILTYENKLKNFSFVFMFDNDKEYDKAVEMFKDKKPTLWKSLATQIQQRLSNLSIR